MDLKETAYECHDWIQLAQDNVQWLDLVNTVGKWTSEFCKR
jgi:hypothetical protein